MGDKIGVDYFAYKKRHAYRTIIVDEETHNPVTLLDGRRSFDGNSLQKWLIVPVPYAPDISELNYPF